MKLIQSLLTATLIVITTFALSARAATTDAVSPLTKTPLLQTRASSQTKTTLNLDQDANILMRTPPRGLCAKADYYCSRGYQNWCEVWEINNCDEL
jgi:hypothetical protein